MSENLSLSSQSETANMIHRYQTQAMQFHQQGRISDQEKAMPPSTLSEPPDFTDESATEPLPFLPPVLPPQTAEDDNGLLRVNVSAAGSALPIPLADILITKKTATGEELIRYLQSDQSGNTTTISLPAPDRTLSDQPQAIDLLPYSVYQVSVRHPLYFPALIEDLQIFAGQTAILPVTLIPLTEKQNVMFAPSVSQQIDLHSLLHDTKGE